MTHTTTHNHPPSEHHLSASPHAVLEAPGTTPRASRGFHRSHSNAAADLTAVLHPRRLPRHEAGRKRGFQRSPQFLLSTPEYVSCQHSGRETIFGDIFNSFCSGRICTYMEQGHSHRARSTPPLSNYSSRAEKEVLDNPCQKGSCTILFFFKSTTPMLMKTTDFSLSVFLPSHQNARSQYPLASNKNP